MGSWHEFYDLNLLSSLTSLFFHFLAMIVMQLIKLNLTVQQTIKRSLISGLTAFSLIGCTQPQPPEAIVEPSQSVKASIVLAEQDSSTLKNLQQAYNSEYNSNVMYLVFALEAHQEGYQDVATLFKTLARAEKIHRDNHARVIQAMGAIPNKTMIVPQVNSTVNNLARLVQGKLSNSIKRESSEREMYPKFIKQAKAENNSVALQTFEHAIAAENRHFQLLAQASENLDNWSQDTRSFYVCQVSGETFDRQPRPGACPQNSDGKSIEQITW